MARSGGNEAAVLEIPHKTRLVDGVDGAQTHRHSGETPKIGHQPRVRIGGEAGMLAQFVAEILEVLLAEAAFEERAAVDAGGGVTLEVDEVARLIGVVGVKEMVETDLEEGG